MIREIMASAFGGTVKGEIHPGADLQRRATCATRAA